MKYRVKTCSPFFNGHLMNRVKVQVKHWYGWVTIWKFDCWKEATQMTQHNAKDMIKALEMGYNNTYRDHITFLKNM